MDTPTKIAVITGAGSGIGRATAHALLADGWSVVLAGRRREMLEETAALAEVPPPRTLVVPTDVRDPAAVAALFDRVKEIYGRVDLLFNNAGISTRGIPFEDLTFEQWSDVVAVNLTGSFLCAQHAFRMMKSQEPQGGRIINNGSVSAHVPRQFHPCASTKHADGLTRSLSSTVVQPVSPAARSTSATPPPSATPTLRSADCRRPARWRPRRALTCASSPTGCAIWPACRSRRTSSS